MPYGVASRETREALADAGWDAERIDATIEVEDEDALTIDVVVEGALDESFTVKAEDATEVVDIIAADMGYANAILAVMKGPLVTYEVVAYIPEHETIYTKRSEN